MIALLYILGFVSGTFISVVIALIIASRNRANHATGAVEDGFLNILNY